MTLADDEDQYGLKIPRITYSDNQLIQHGMDQMEQHLQAAGGKEIFRQVDDTNHLNGTARMGDDPRSSVVNAVCDGSVFPTVGGVNPSETIQLIACRTADRIKQMAGRGELRAA